MLPSENSSFMIPGIRFHHVGLLTGNPDAAAAALQVFGYTVAAPVNDPVQEVQLRMASRDAGHHRIEIITPMSSNTALANLVRRRSDYIYHSCFTVGDVNNALEILKRAGLRAVTISPPKPAVLFAGAPVSFYAIDGVGLVEFIESADSK